MRSEWVGGMESKLMYAIIRPRSSSKQVESLDQKIIAWLVYAVERKSHVEVSEP